MVKEVKKQAIYEISWDLLFIIFRKESSIIADYFVFFLSTGEAHNTKTNSRFSGYVFPIREENVGVLVKNWAKYLQSPWAKLY